MDGNSINFARRTGLRPRPRRRQSLPQPRRFAWQSTAAILAANEAELAGDVGDDIRRAQVKLRQIRRQLRVIRERAAQQERRLETAAGKLAGAINAALLSTSGD